MWFITAGEPIHLPCPTTLTTDQSSNLTTSQTVTGRRRASYFGGYSTLRTWSVDTKTATGDELAALEAFTAGIGISDLGFIPEGAEHQNLLTPGASLLATAPGFTPRTITTTGSGKVFPGGITSTSAVLVAARVPWVFPGQAYTLSIVGKSGAVCSIRWLRANGAVIRYDKVTASTADFERAHATHTAPADAAYFDLHINGAVAAPAITLGDTLRPWAVGKAAKSVVVEPASTQLLSAWDPAHIYTAASYKILEVGAYV